MGKSDWMRIGAFYLESSVALLTERLSSPSNFAKDTIENMLQSSGCCMLDNVKPGIWIAGSSNSFYSANVIITSVNIVI